VAAYRIALEAMANTIRHARADTCTVAFEVDDSLRLNIWDDGSGLPAGNNDGVGLSSMRERTAELGGEIEIHTAEKGGTVVSVRLPLEEL
jgi:signal transduction histidine kinase